MVSMSLVIFTDPFCFEHVNVPEEFLEFDHHYRMREKRSGFVVEGRSTSAKEQ